MRIEDDIKLDFCDVLLRPKRSTIESRGDVELWRDFKFRHGSSVTCVPVVAANMDTVGTFPMGHELAKHGMLTAIHKHAMLEGWIAQGNAFCMFSTGLNQGSSRLLFEDIPRADKADFIVLDVANGYTVKFLDLVKETREKNPDLTIIAGNVVTGDMTEALLLAGADIVKVGIGSGAACTTRKVAGVGYPQLSAVIECADAAHGLGGHVMSDGGCASPGDIAKAFGAGADFVMLGGMLAGHDESGGKKVYTTMDGEPSHVEFYGMSSDTAMEKHQGGVAAHRASEGKTVRIPYRGSVESTLQQILGGLRSACAYVGARTLKDLPKCCTFIKVNRQLNQVFDKFE